MYSSGVTLGGIGKHLDCIITHRPEHPCVAATLSMNHTFHVKDFDCNDRRLRSVNVLSHVRNKAYDSGLSCAWCIGSTLAGNRGCSHGSRVM